MFWRVCDLSRLADFATRPVVFGTLSATMPGDIAAAPGVITVKPTFAPSAAIEPGCASISHALHHGEVPRNEGCLQGSIAPMSTNSRTGEDRKSTRLNSSHQ